MKISQVIKRLEEAREYAGGEDLEVVIGETNGTWHDKIDVNVDSMGKWDNEHWDDKIAIIQAYIVFR